MNEEAVMSQVMSATQVRTHFGRVMREVATTGEPVIVERGGEPLVAVITLADLERLQEVKSTDLSPANQAALDWLTEWKKTPDPVGSDWWDEFERELEQNPVVFGGDE
jgi:prevent-host-death family protein